MLFVIGGLSAQQYNITKYEYWTDDDYSNRKSEIITPSKMFLWQTTVSCENLTQGIHTFNARFRDNAGKWSPVISSYFYKTKLPLSNNIIAYEYWLDNQKERKEQKINPSSQFVFAQSLDLDSLSNGLHHINIRFKDANGKWSSTVSQYFNKLPQLIDNKLVAYEYWINDQYDKKFSGTINEVKSFILLDNLDCTLGGKATNTVSFRFKDVVGQWSPVMTEHFYRPVEAGFTTITGLSEVTFTNTTKYADRYEWDFGDGNTTTQVHPEHAYTEPGAYLVKLIAHNNELTDSIKHYIEIEGVKKITNNKGGNGGLASFDVLGGGLDENVIVKLVKGGETIDTYSMYKKEPGIVCTTFDLKDKTIGFYDVVIISKGKTYTFTNGFEIEEARQPDTWVKFEGFDRFVIGRWQTMTIHYGNNGNLDIFGLPINIFMPTNLEVDLLFDLIDPVTGEKLENTDNFFNVREINGKVYDQDVRVLSVLIPHVLANETGSISFKFKPTIEDRIDFICQPKQILNEHYFGTNLVDQKENTDHISGYIFEDNMNINMQCYNAGIATMLLDAIGMPNSKDPTNIDRKRYFNFAFKVFDLVQSCSSSLKKVSLRGTGSATGTDDCKDCHGKKYKINPLYIGEANSCLAMVDCSECMGFLLECGESNHSVSQFRSSDPNEILGPAGYADQNHINKRDYLNYAIYFENDPEKATAPAQEIFLTDTLDLTKFNPEQFSFGTFTFRDITIEAPSGENIFSTDVDMRSKGENIIVRVSAIFDKIKGIINWHLIALDPVTMDLTENPNLGILYPNINPPVGEGNVTYSIGLLSELMHGNTIENQAHIIFDLNEPLATNVYINTLDLEKPVSSINPSYEIMKDSVIILSWGGTDSGSGIANYNMYVSENDKDYIHWLYNTKDISGEFEGKQGNMYKFYVTATDNVGNIEDMKSEAELTVLLIPTNIKFRENDTRGLTVIPNPIKNVAIIEFNLQKTENISLSLHNNVGQKIMDIYNGEAKAGLNRISFDAGKLNAGFYFITLQSSETEQVSKIKIK